MTFRSEEAFFHAADGREPHAPFLVLLDSSLQKIARRAFMDSKRATCSVALLLFLELQLIRSRSAGSTVRFEDRQTQ